MNMTDKTPATFLDVLKLSKILALELGWTRITPDLVTRAVTQYFDTTDLDEKIGEKLGIRQRGKPVRTSGAERLSRYPEKPPVSIVKEVAALRTALGDQVIAGLYLPHASSEQGQAVTNEPATPQTHPTQPAPPLGRRDISFDDCLKLAKRFALQRPDTTITLEVLRQALVAYVDTTGLSDTQAQLLGVERRPPDESGGQMVLAQHTPQPKVSLAQEVQDVRKKLMEQPPRLSLPPSSSPQSGGTASPANTSTPTLSLTTESRSAQQHVNELIERIGKVVVGQGVALQGLRIELLARATKLHPPGKPQLLVLSGYGGTGKTLLGNQLAEVHGRSGLMLNMASFQSRNEGFGLTGLRRGYDGAGPGRLTSFVRNHPDAVVIFDNVEQAHPDNQNILANLMANGYLEDEYGFGNEQTRDEVSARRVSFAQALLVFIVRPSPRLLEDDTLTRLIARDSEQATQLIAEDLSMQRGAADKASTGPTETGLSPHLGAYLATARILPFAELSIQSLTGIARQTLRAMEDHFGAQGIQVVFDSLEMTAQLLTLSFGPDIKAIEVCDGARRWLSQLLFAHPVNNPPLTPSRLQITLAPSSRAWLENQGDFIELGRTLFRRREVVRYTIRQTLTHDLLTLEIHDARIERIKDHRHYGGDGGFAVEMPDLRFTDIKGHVKAKERLQKIVQLLSPKPAAASRRDTVHPKGVLLFGKPGTGKTMLAKALAAEAELPFIATSGPQLLDMHHTRAVFARARRFAPSIVFIDEIDALGYRGRGGMDHAINQLLTEIDGFSSSGEHPVFVIAATNFLPKVDPALLRSGRLDLHIEVPLLDRDARRYFVEERLSKLPRPAASEPGAWDTEVLVTLTAGMSGADLEKVYRESLLALPDEADATVTQDQLLEQVNAIKYGERRHRPPLGDYLEAVAFHEAGHAVVSALLNPDMPIEQVTIIGRGDASGFMTLSPDADHSRPLNRKEVMDMLCVLLSGRQSQLRKFPSNNARGGCDNGASSDLEKATALAWQAVTLWGLDDEFGWKSLAPLETSPPHWLESAQQRVDAWLTEARTRSERIVDEHWPVIQGLAQRLLEEETVTGREVLQHAAALSGAGELA